MNKASLFAFEYRLVSMTKADSLASLNSLHDFCRGFLLALLTAQIVSEEEFDDFSLRMNSAVISARDRLVSQQSYEDKSWKAFVKDRSQNDSETEQLSISAAPSRLSVHSLFYRSFFTHVQRLHPKLWCPFGIWVGLHALKRLPAGWPPLPRKRSLVCCEGEVHLSSVQAAT